ncbi:MAG: PKD domain-containing protein [Thermoplasmatales archaeon]|nr:PKD domain-containing protein [Thermoplasmatales archaeon]
MKYKLTAVLALVTMLTAGALFSSENTEADSEDVRVFYAYTLYLGFDGDASWTIEWDFGDGSEPENTWNVVHTYQEKGDYVITQTVWNNIGHDTDTITVRIMGHPTVTFHSGTDDFISSIEVPLIGKDAQVLPDVGIPERTGFNFEGWYYDEDCTICWDPDDTVGEHIDLYAKWGSDSAAGEDPDEDGRGLDNAAVYILIGGASLVAALLVILILSRRKADKG